MSTHSSDHYTPSPEILQKYSRVLVNFALNSGQGVKKGEVVRLNVSESAKPLLVALRNQILQSGAHPLINYSPDGISRDFFTLANPAQINFFPDKYVKGLVGQIDHSISIISEVDKHELEGIDPKLIMAKSLAYKPAKDWLDKKENSGKFTWTLGLFGTPAMAKEAGLTLKEYWEQIMKACFLDESDPVGKWKAVFKENERVQKRLNALEIEKVHVVGNDCDLWIKLGSDRKWLTGSGRNIPSFEIFISPDWRGTQGWINFNQPLYRYGNAIKGVQLEFKDGYVIKSSATHNSQVLKEMIASPNADKVGEFSLTDKRLSRIDKFMAETLYDENISGPFGNTHIALGSAYKESYTGDPSRLNRTQWEKRGFNDSGVHTDIVSTSDRLVTAILSDGSEKVIYRDGEFIV